MKELDLLIVRHGKTSHNLEGKTLGLSDPPLMSEGVAEVENLAHHLKIKGVAPDRIYASLLQRHMQTAEGLRVGLGGVIVQSPELKEIDYGVYEGVDRDGLRKVEFGYDSQKMREGQAETVEEVEDRAAAFLNTALSNDDNCIVIVTSAFVASVMTQILLRIPRTFANIQPLATADYNRFTVGRGGENELDVIAIQRNCLKGPLDI